MALRNRFNRADSGSPGGNDAETRSMRPFSYSSIKLPQEIGFNKGFTTAKMRKCYILEQDYSFEDADLRLK